MKTIDNITVTNGRLRKALNNQVTPIIMPNVSKQISNAVKDSKIQTGVMTKFYPYLDKCEVQLDNGDLVLCKILHRFGMELMDFYTPEGEYDFCDTLREPCIIPHDGSNCLILDINDISNEQIMIGYFVDDEIEFWDPAQKGNFKINALTGTNEFWIKFGSAGLDIRCSKSPTTEVGTMEDEMTTVNNVSSDEVYTKEEVDKMIEDLRKEIHGEDSDDNC